MASLAGTKWVIWHPNPNGITFKTGGACAYGPYVGTFTESGSSFQATVSDPHNDDPNWLGVQFNGTHADGKGQGTMKNLWRSGFNPPDPGPANFTMTIVK